MCRCASVWRQLESVLHRPGQERQHFAVRPFHEAGAVVRRERMAALAARNHEIPLALVPGRDGEAFGGTELDAVLHPWHIVVAGQLKPRHIEQ